MIVECIAADAKKPMAAKTSRTRGKTASHKRHSDEERCAGCAANCRPHPRPPRMHKCNITGLRLIEGPIGRKLGPGSKISFRTDGARISDKAITKELAAVRLRQTSLWQCQASTGACGIHGKTPTAPGT